MNNAERWAREYGWIDGSIFSQGDLSLSVDLGQNSPATYSCQFVVDPITGQRESAIIYTFKDGSGIAMYGAHWDVFDEGKMLYSGGVVVN